MVYVMYHINDFNKLMKNKILSFYMGVVTFDDPQNDLNDLEKIEPIVFWWNGPLKVPNQS